MRYAVRLVSHSAMAASVGILLAFAALLILPRNASAQGSTDLIASGSWDDASNWSSGLPTSSVDTWIENNLSVSATTGVTGSTSNLYIGNGTLNISGGIVSGFCAVLDGTASVTSGAWDNSGVLYVGNSRIGTLKIDGGVVTNGDTGLVGFFAGSNGTVTVSSGTWINSSQLQIGNSGTGTLNVNGGTVTDIFGFLGSGAQGTATVTSGTWVTAMLYAGYSQLGAGTLNVNGGTVTTSIGNTVDDGGSPAFTIGCFGAGTVNLTGSGFLSIGGGAGTLLLASGTGSTGTLNLGTGGTVGTLDVAIVVGGSGIATVNFNHTGGYTFAPMLTGNLSVNKLGSGTTTLTGSNTYTGATNVAQGALNVSGSLSNTATVSVASGARVSVPSGGMVNNAAVISLSGTLSGAGSVGTVTAIGGVIAPSIPGSHLTINGPVSLDGSSSFQFTLGSTKASYDSVWSGAITLVTDAELILADPEQVGTTFTNGDIVALFQNTTGGNPQFTGTFESVTLPVLSTGLSWSTTNLYSKGTVQVVPEPNTWAMLATGFGALLLYRRRP